MIEPLAALSGLLAQAAPMRAVQVQSLWDFAVKGGPVMVPIGVASLVGLAVVIERLVSLRRRRVIPPDLPDGVRTALRAGSPDRRAALELCEQNGSPLARIFAAGLRRLDEPPERLEKFVLEAGERVVQLLRKNLRVLAVIVAIAPLLGLLGTIFGMITAFQTVAVSGEALGKTELLAKGIYEALITTAAGLMVAIPGLVCHHWLVAKVERLVSEMDALVVAFVEEFGARGATPQDAARTIPAAVPARPALDPKSPPAAPPLRPAPGDGEDELRLAEPALSTSA